ncbi:MAG TPA: CcoQ/FixQ family Cbb3-type cytochrome c oxidase assembly chaperone [bacterium]|nr:CcoQ/FixQ family Cbb3-type cytochrome c oxidase assembly chaperone [bacterium]
MLKRFLDTLSLYDLPIIATLLFVAMFLIVLLRVFQRSRQPEYKRMASLPLDADAVEETDNDR